MASGRQRILRSVQDLVEREGADTDDGAWQGTTDLDEFHFDDDQKIQLRVDEPTKTTDEPAKSPERDFLVGNAAKPLLLQTPIEAEEAPAAILKEEKPAAKLNETRATQALKLNFSGEIGQKTGATVELADADPAIDPKKSSPNIELAKAEPSVELVKAEPTIELVKAEPAVEKSTAEPETPKEIETEAPKAVLVRQPREMERGTSSVPPERLRMPQPILEASDTAADARLATHLRQTDKVATAAIAHSENERQSRLPILVAFGGASIIVAALVGGMFFSQNEGAVTSVQSAQLDAATPINALSVLADMSASAAERVEPVGFIAPVQENLAPGRPIGFPALNYSSMDATTTAVLEPSRPQIEYQTSGVLGKRSAADDQLPVRALASLDTAMPTDMRLAPELVAVASGVDLFSFAPQLAAEYEPRAPQTEDTGEQVVSAQVAVELAAVEAVASIASVATSIVPDPLPIVSETAADLLLVREDPPIKNVVEEAQTDQIAQTSQSEAIKVASVINEPTARAVVPDFEARPIPASASVNDTKRWVGTLPFMVSAQENGLLIASLADMPLPEWAEAGDRVLAVNGWAVATERDFVFALSQTQPNASNGEGMASFAVAKGGEETAKVETMPVEFSRMLKSQGGTTFLAEFTGKRWKTRVTATGTDSDFEVGDVIVRDFASKGKFGDASSMGMLLEWSNQNSIDVLEFAIIRNGNVERAQLSRTGEL